MSDFGYSLSKVRDNVTLGIFLTLASALGITAWYHYMLGHYHQILWPALSSPLILALAVVRHISTDAVKRATSYPTLITLSLVLLNTGPELSPLYQQWFYMLPLLAYFILPVRKATISLALIFCLFVLTDLENINPLTLAELSVNLGLFSGICFIFAFTQERQTRTLEKLSGKDSLTGAFTAGQLNKRLISEVSRAKVTQRPLSSLLLSIHNLEEAAQSQGEQKALTLLVKCSQMIKEISRAGDEIYRVGNSSFLLLLPNTSINGSIVVKERLIQQVAEHLELSSISQDITLSPITLQINEDADQFMARATHEPAVNSQNEL